MRSYNYDDIAKFLPKRAKFLGNKVNLIISSLKPVTSSEETSMTWINPKNADKLELLKNTKAGLVICDYSFEKIIPPKKTSLILTKNPKLLYINIANELFKKDPTYGIHPTATIHPDAKIDDYVHVGPNSVIGKCMIGSGTIIQGNCYIYDNVRVGKDCLIKPNAVIGGDGYGFANDEDTDKLVMFPHFGSVVIGDNVYIGSCTCIDSKN